MKRSPIRPISKKRAVINRKRAKLIEATVEGKPCLVQWDGGCQFWAVTAHEPLLRSRGGDPTDPAQTVATCSHCHGQIHDNPIEATKRGWMKHAWEGAK
jgi:hypothetical protein